MTPLFPVFLEVHAQALIAANEQLRRENNQLRFRLGWYRWHAAQQKQRQVKATGAEVSPRPVQMALGF